MRGAKGVANLLHSGIGTWSLRAVEKTFIIRLYLGAVTGHGRSSCCPCACQCHKFHLANAIFSDMPASRHPQELGKPSGEV